MPAALRTSISHPLIINTLAVGGGELGLTFCPGKKQAQSLSGGWDRDLELDIAAIKAWGASLVISLLEEHEYAELKVAELPAVFSAHFKWFNLPIRDKCAPDAHWSEQWQQVRGIIKQQLSEQQKILIHCKGGFGRTGTVAALILMDQGLNADEAIARCRTARKFAVETQAQEDYVCRYKAY